MTSDEIREAFLGFFEQRDHRRLPSASLVPAEYDPSVLLTTAGMHPLKPYFMGQERPPHHRLTSCQKVFRTTDVENVGNTTRHLTFFEMLGNFSIGDYFKQAAVEFAWQFSLEVLGFEPADLWATVFEGDEELGLGPDEEAIEAWLSVGVPRERIVLCPRSENFWQAGPTGPCGPCSELYFDRGLEWGRPDDLPGGENERFLEYWNLVFMQFNQDPVNTLTPLPAQNIDTGLGLNRMAILKQGVGTVFETDQFAPLVELGRELATEEPSDRSLRILADHSRAMTFLVADGVVPSNESRGYILRRVMRRAILHGRRLGMQPGFLSRYRERVTELMGGAYPELAERGFEIDMWLRNEEGGFGHTLEQGTRLLDELIARARERGDEGISSDDAFRLHDTFGFPIDLTLELVAEHGLGVDEAGFEALMEQQRARSAVARTGPGAADELRTRALELARGAGFATEFTGYETLEQHTTVGAAEQVDGRVLVKLAESPFYATGGGQIADSGVVQCESGECRARVADVLRLGDDQAVVLEVEQGALEPGERVVARVSPEVRHATECNHTATHLLHAALRERLGPHVRQAGSYVGPDKLRFDFTHGEALSDEDVAWVEDRVNAEILANHRVRALTMPLEEARRLGAMALFGEKYGDVVRVVQIGDGSFSRELCGGTHVRSTAEIGVFKLTGESSSAANVRRIEALTGPEAVALLRRHDGVLREAATLVRKRPEEVSSAVAELQVRAKAARRAEAAPAVDAAALAERAATVDGARVLAEQLPPTDPKSLPDLADRVKGKLGDSAIVLGTATEGRVALVVAVSPALVERGVKAGQIVKTAAQVVGGGGGGRDTMAQAGGRDPSKLPEALDAAREAIAAALGSAA
ncbi:MAG TPA: alanine--tRNA ligase [Solirubrobacteraceae bacterium]|jgi:alanyl-tRNA synthetase|nr:alanine--tRNA ligase [Solirubrobacteraceae bacterium]